MALEIRCFPRDDGAFQESVADYLAVLATSAAGDLAAAINRALEPLGPGYPDLRVRLADQLALVVNGAPIAYAFRDGHAFPRADGGRPVPFQAGS